MTVRTRLLLLITLLVIACSLGTGGTLAWLAWRSILDRAKEDAVLLARLLADSASVSEQSALEAEKVLGERMLAEAFLAGQLIDLGRNRSAEGQELHHLLQVATAHTGLEEIWILDATGKVELSSLDEIDEIRDDEFSFASVASLSPLLTGRVAGVVTEPVTREVDNRSLVFAGVPTANGAALVAHDVDYLAGLRDRLGLRRLIGTLLGGQTVQAIWIFNDAQKILAAGSRDSAGEPLPDEAALTSEAMRTGEPATQFEGTRLSVAVPILDADRIPAGAALVRVPTERLRREIQTYFAYGLALSGGLLLLGIGATTVTARRLSQPIMTLTAAARAVERRKFDAGSLRPLLMRRDEFGQLASVFQGMAVELLGRERELDRLVKERTAELQQTTDELSATYAQIEQELEAAQTLQRAILPQHFPQRAEFSGSALMVPARQLAGDFYDVLELPDGRIGVLIADVSGKGVPAAFFMGISRTVLRAAALEGRPPGVCLAEANDVLCRTNPMELFVTVFYGILDPRDGSFVYANGGHNPPLRWGRDADEPVPLATTPNLMLGMIENMPFREGSVVLEPHDVLVLYTDGVTEAQNRAGDEFTEERLIRAIASAGDDDPQAIIAHLVERLRQFAAGVPFADDLTCLVLRYAGPGSGRPPA